MQIVISTDGRAKPTYYASSDAPDLAVPEVEDIRHGRLTGNDGEQWINRDYVFIELGTEQAFHLVEDILDKLGQVTGQHLVIYAP